MAKKSLQQQHEDRNSIGMRAFRGAPSQQYKDNYDKIFNKPKKESNDSNKGSSHLKAF